MNVRRWLSGVGALALALVTVACTSPTVYPAPDANSRDAGPIVGDPARGMMVVASSSCATAGLCHGSDLSGSTMPSPGSMVYPRNITPDATGIASWTDAQIETAVRTGVTPTGQTLCANMLRFPTMSAQQMADLIAYLHTVPPVSRTIPTSTCP